MVRLFRRIDFAFRKTLEGVDDVGMSGLLELLHGFRVYRIPYSLVAPFSVRALWPKLRHQLPHPAAANAAASNDVIWLRRLRLRSSRRI